MNNPWDHLPSIWDGWEKQLFGRRWSPSVRDGHCALGWLDRRLESTAVWEFPGFAVHFETGRAIGEFKQLRQLIEDYAADVQRRTRRVANFIRANFPETFDWYNDCTTRSENVEAVIAAANNSRLLTPEQFRELDRHLEYEYQQEQLGKQIDAIVIDADFEPMPSPTMIERMDFAVCETVTPVGGKSKFQSEDFKDLELVT